MRVKSWGEGRDIGPGKDGGYAANNFFIVASRPKLCELTNIDGFLESPLAEKEWELKTRSGVISLDAESLKSPLGKLTEHSLLLITGPQRVGKSTLLLHFVDECLQGTIGPWRIFVFINPYLTPKELETVLYDVETKLTSFRDYDSRQILFVADGLKRTGETDENYASKCHRLFEWISGHKYKLIASVRDDQKRTLRKILSDKERDGLDRWSPLDLDEEGLRPDGRFENVKKLLIKYLMCDLYKDEIRVPIAFDHPEFNECVKLVREKSDGLVGYIVFLVDDISVSTHEFSRKTVERYPRGMTGLVWNTISRDYFVQGDKALPLLLTFLTKQQYPVTKQFVESLTEWGVDDLDGDTSIDKEEILLKMGNLLTFHAEQSFFEVELGAVAQYSLKNQVREAIEDGLLSSHDIPNLDEVIKAFSDVGDHFESLITVTYFRRLQEDLAKRKLPSDNYETWYIFADIAKLWGVGSLKIESRIHALKSAIDFFVNNIRKDVQRTKDWNYLEKTVSLVLRRAVDAIPIEDCDLAIRFYELASVDPEDSWSRWALGQFYEKKNQDSEAIKCYVESKNAENTSRGYGSLIKKLDSMKEKAREDVQIEFLELSEMAAIKAIECYAGEHRNWSDLARVLMQKGDMLMRKAEFGKAIESFDRAGLAYKKAIEMNERFSFPSYVDDNKRQYQTEIAWIMGKRARAEFHIGRLDEAIRDKKMQIDLEKISETKEVTNNDRLWLARYTKQLVLQGFIAPLLESILDLGELAIKGSEKKQLSNQWYNIALMLDDVEPQAVGGDLEDLKLSALCHALSDDPHNELAQQAIRELKDIAFYGIDKTQFTSKYHQECAESVDQKRILWILIQKCFSAIIWTSDFCNHLMKKRDIRNEEIQRHSLSSRWSEIGWIITTDFLSTIPRELAIRSLELSIWFCEDNASSLYNLACEYLHGGKADLALKAFTKSISLEAGRAQKRYSCLSEIGIGKVHESKKELVLARGSYMKASCMLTEYSKHEPEEAVSLLINIAQGLKDLTSFTTDVNAKIDIMTDVMETYNRALAISKEAQLVVLRETLDENVNWSRNWTQWLQQKKMLTLLSVDSLLKTSLVTLLHLTIDLEQIETLYQREFAFHKLKNYEKSVEYNNKILRMQPANIVAYINKAQNLRILERYGEALECVDKALEIDDKNARAVRHKGLILLKSGKRENDKTAKHDEIMASIVWFDLCLRSDPNDAPAWYNKAEALHTLGGKANEEEATRCYVKALELEPKNWVTWYDLIHATLRLIMQKRTVEESDFIAFNELVKKAVGTIDEHDKGIFMTRARKTVIHCFKKAIFEDHINSREKLSLVLHEFEKSPGRPVETPAPSEILDSCLRDREFSEKSDKVSRVFDNKILRAQPTNIVPYINKAQHLCILERYGEALECVDKALEIDDKNALALRIKGKALQGLGGTNNEEKAIIYFTKALEIKPEDLVTWCDKIHSTFRLSMRRGADEESGFTVFADVVKEALGKIDEHNKDAFMTRVRKSVVHCFKKAIFEDHINSREKLSLVLHEFEKKTELLVGTPSESEILDSCKRDEEFSRKRDKVSRVFDL